MFKVSSGNSKLGKIYNINMPAGVTCAPDAPCRKEGCYALKGTFRFPSVKNCYAENLRTFIHDPLQAENDILLQLPHIDSKYAKLYCRVHSSGDFYNMDYLKMIISICEKRPFMNFLAFTKKYDLVNEYIATYGELPINLNIVFSHWKGYKMDNPYNMPIAVIEEVMNDNIDITNGFKCTGLCEECYQCWYLLHDEIVIFNKH